MIRLVNQIRQVLGATLPLNVVFQSPTLEQMAAVLRRSHVPDPSVSHPSATTRHKSQTPPFFCLSHGPLFASRLNDIPVHMLGSYVDDLRDFGSIREIAEANITRMREHQKEGPYRLSGFCGMALVAFEMARLLALEGQEVSLLAMIDPSPVRKNLRVSSSVPRY